MGSKGLPSSSKTSLRLLFRTRTEKWTTWSRLSSNAYLMELPTISSTTRPAEYLAREEMGRPAIQTKTSRAAAAMASTRFGTFQDFSAICSISAASLATIH